MLNIGDKVYYEYKIASFPYDSKDAAYADIRTNWKGADCTTWFDQSTGKWYIITK